MRLKIALIIAALAVSVLGSQPARAGEVLYASGPGGALGAPYTVPVLVIQKGDTVKYLNLDAGFHDVRSLALGADREWCTTKPFNFTTGQCPLFTSKLIGIAQTSPVYGIEDVQAGANYEFVCSIHPWMKGTLVVLPE